MGKILFVNDGRFLLRNFLEYQLFYPDGKISKSEKFDGLIIITMGEDDERRVELFLKTTPRRDRVELWTKAFLLGFLTDMLIRILVRLS